MCVCVGGRAQTYRKTKSNSERNVTIRAETSVSVVRPEKIVGDLAVVWTAARLIGYSVFGSTMASKLNYRHVVFGRYVADIREVSRKKRDDVRGATDFADFETDDSFSRRVSARRIRTGYFRTTLV